MKTNVKSVLCLLIVVSFVVAVVFCVIRQQVHLAKHELGPMDMSELNFVVGGSNEGTDCYTKDTNGCSTSESNSSYCHSNTDFNMLSDCPSVAKVFSGNPTFSFRTKEPQEMSNSLGKKTTQVTCYDMYIYNQERYQTSGLLWGYSCSSSEDDPECNRDYVNLDLHCETCILQYDGPPITIDSDLCSDP
ncbi:MAG: hypothetical protein LBC74_15600 [Planctomycetaceae bacterium]|jgi:hypothetical protein|nr:hypothetical protein [Planctomycetaceae bacterium]